MSVEVVQEVLFHRLRRTGQASAIAQARDLRTACTVHSFDTDVLDEAIALQEVTRLRGRDAVHAATARRAGLRTFVTLDADFDAVPGLARLDPTARA